MKVTGARVVFLDSPAGKDAEFNRWYDLDHIPEFVALDGVISGRRYVATPACKELRRPTTIEGMKDGKGTYCTVYFFGDDDLPAVTAAQGIKGTEIRQQGRRFPDMDVVRVQDFALESVVVSKDLHLDPTAVPHLGHQSLLLGIGEMLDMSKRDAVGQWYDETHHPDLLEIPEFLAILRFSSLAVDPGPPAGTHLLNLYYFEGPATVAYEALRALMPSLRERDRYLPGLEQARRLIYVSPYEVITPLDYGFLDAGS
jgi:hypothetical protein